MNYITRKKASQMLSVSVKTIDRWIRCGRISAFKPFNSSKVLIDRDSLSQENLQSSRPTFKNNF
ncbi:helix-turn-helix domain-containing protein [Psychroflexus sp. MES1-P1E]|uniref:helix-turn-helix domain-containing protein n=1 Tax=Psychroflexus sp. MES1-P1E TaxID=2058320 RepID=UPI000C7A18AA|nr:helix-turn-helix domain-containing protein [Psychroflexus sp. MES1-P1E]PKG42779.1 hypothetical protein CXF67_08445 [Psychroflexus sp. MES1-P1E]